MNDFDLRHIFGLRHFDGSSYYTQSTARPLHLLSTNPVMCTASATSDYTSILVHLDGESVDLRSAKVYGDDLFLSDEA